MMLSWEYPPRIVGGISPHVYDLSQELVKLGIEVHVVTKATSQAPDEEVESSGVVVHRVHLDDSPRNFVHEIELLNGATERRVRQLLEDWRPGGQPTLFHAHDWLALEAARELKFEYSLPMVATIHATESGRNQGVHNDLQRYISEEEYWLSFEAWRLIVCSEYMKQHVSDIFSCPSDKIDVIFNGVTPEKFQFEWSDSDRLSWRKRFADDNENIVLFVGRFVREKGIQDLLSAAGSILATHPNTRFLIVGGGHRELFERFVDWFGIADKVTFTGFMGGRDLLQMFRIADVAVFPSLYEPFGIVALEAMAAGTSVVASEAGGLKEVVMHDVTGTSCYPGDPESVAWAVRRVLDDSERSLRLRQNASLRLKTDFEWPMIAKKTVAVYEQVWNEFLESYWAADTVWPVVAGAEERWRNRQLSQRALSGATLNKPRPATQPDAPSFEQLESEKYAKE
jgi:glycosyltransferase involved in cell wall biosynthesis